MWLFDTNINGFMAYLLHLLPFPLKAKENERNTGKATQQIFVNSVGMFSLHSFNFLISHPFLPVISTHPPFYWHFYNNLFLLEKNASFYYRFP